jgi:protein-tyrosine phosphatase
LTEQSLLRFENVTEAFLRSLDILAFHVSLLDERTPTLIQALQILALLESMRKQQRAVLVHCFGGRGRTGTILHLYYLAQGWTWEETAGRLSATRLSCLRINEQQRAFLAAFQSWQTRIGYHYPTVEFPAGYHIPPLREFE